MQALKWCTITVTGRESHTGATDFANRSDALLAASKMILRSHQVATEFSSLASTGLLSVFPSSMNTIAGSVTFSLDLRSGQDDRIRALEEALKFDFEKIAKGEDVGNLNDGCTPGRGCTVTWKTDSATDVTLFDAECLSCVEEASYEMLGDNSKHLVRRMQSGPGHDRQV